MIKLDPHSWLLAFAYRYTNRPYYSTNICSLFWHCVFSVFATSIITLIGFFLIQSLLHTLAVYILWIAGVTPSIVTIFPYTTEYFKVLIVVGHIELLIGSICAVIAGWVWYVENTPLEEKLIQVKNTIKEKATHNRALNNIVTVYYGFKERFCPIVTWRD